MHKMAFGQMQNILRAAVMGANDGILSVAGIVIGVAAATTDTHKIWLAGFAGALAGTISMAMGEYVSVHSQADAQAKAQAEGAELLVKHPHQALAQVTAGYEQAGISSGLAQQAAKEVMEKDSLATLVYEQYGFDIKEKISASYAALASMLAFPLGSILPLSMSLGLPGTWRIEGTFLAVVVALALTGYSAARFSGANPRLAVLRNLTAGLVTMIGTFGLGWLIGR
ncbi:VIT1/CCC1 transporter family protein [Weissella halotolerans]|nr:VIT family protein [Weissella halotolerans]